jgi:sulfane dehydrogenase subunit SoxC
MAADKPSRRDVLAGLAGLGAAAGALSVARAAEPAAPAEPLPRAAVPADATKVLGTPALPRSERSPFEDPKVAPSGQVSGPSYSPIETFHGTITPTDLQFQRHHGGIAHIDPTKWKLLLHGLVDKPLVFTLDDLKRFPTVSRVMFLECSGNGRNAYRSPKPESNVQHLDGLISNLEWTGVPLSLLLREAGVKPEATWFVAEGGDASVMARSVPIAKAWDDALVVFAANGEPLRPAHGYPARLFLPGWEANMSIKWLRRIELTDQPLMSKDETSKYTDPLPGDRARQFSFVCDCKSILTQPTWPTKLSGPGFWPISGLAWSGRGSVTRVEVSTDGGRSWTDAKLQGPVLPKAVTRFHHDWQWDGQPTRIQTRATDDTGYVQPSLAEFRKVRGLGTDFHFNPIRTWEVRADGQVLFVPDPEAT